MTAKKILLCICLYMITPNICRVQTKDDIQKRKPISTNFDEKTSKAPKILRYRNKHFGPVKIKKAKRDSSEFDEELSPYSIRQQLTHMVKKLPNTSTAIEVIGRTVEYNEIVLLKMTSSHDERNFRTSNDKFDDSEEEKKIIFIVQCLSVMGARNLNLHLESYFDSLMSFYAYHLESFDIYVIPMANPDGFAFLTRNILWNKNVALHGDCPGVALDRNFDVFWNNNRSINSCNQDYPGPVPFSEAETRAVRDVLHRYSHKMVAYFHIHAGSYDASTFKGDAVLYPRGYTDISLDEDKYIDLKAEIEEAMRNASFRVLSVTVDTLYNWYGKVGGSSVDYASTVYGIPYALELVMQLYEDENGEYYAWNALHEIWLRILSAVFDCILKSLYGDEVRK